MYGVQALDQRDAVPFYQELAEASGGRYLRLRHFDVIVDMFLAGKFPFTISSRNHPFRHHATFL